MDNPIRSRRGVASVAAVTEAWAVPGYDVQELLGFGATGEVWRARSLASGELVALKRVRPDAPPAAVDALRREVAVLATLDTPYVVRLREVLGEGADTVLVLDLAGGGSLAALLARRGHLDPGEVVTVAAPLASALAAAHARGLVHGDVTPANVLFTTEGMPLLSDLGLARLAGSAGPVDGTAEYVDPVVAAGGAPDAASDVWALGAVCHHMLAGTPPHDGGSVGEVLDAARAGSRAPLGLLAPTAPRPLVAAVEAALSADPSLRPSASELAALLRRSHAVAPVRLSGVPAAADAPDVRPTHAVHAGVVEVAAPVSRRRPSRRVLVGAGAVVALLLAAAAGWASGRTAPADLVTVAPSPVAPAAAAGLPDWASTIDRLDAARAAAFATADAARLRDVYAPGSPPLVADTRAVGALRAAGRTARGVRHAVRRVTQTSYDGTVVRLRVVDVLAGYDLVARDGSVLGRTAERAESSYDVELVRTPDGWRVRAIRPV